MTLREYKESLDEFIKDNPEALDLEVITSIDDEGNGYNKVYYTPSLGLLDDDSFISNEELENEEPNVVCLN